MAVISTRRNFGFSLLAACTGAFAQSAQSVYRKRRVALAEKVGGRAVLLFGEVEPKDDRAQFRQDSNFYYLTGWQKPGAALVLKSRPYQETLFLPAGNALDEHLYGPQLSAGDPSAPVVAGVDEVKSISALGAERSVALHLGDVERFLKVMRMVKDQQEMVLIRKVIDASIAAHLTGILAVKPGRHEYEIAAKMQYELQILGCERLAYPSIVASGINSAYAHHVANPTVIKDGDVVLIDVGGECSMYAADITRMTPANGKFTPRQRELYDVVLGAQEAAVKDFRVGESTLWGATNSLHDVAGAYIASHGVDPKHFQGGFGKLGHHVGLDVHDLADYTVPLQRGNVFTLEPGVYLPEEKLGIRIEDMYWVDPAGKLVKLTAALPN